MLNKNNCNPSCLIALAASITACSGPSADTKPNIVMILADDMGWGDINANGNDLISTPVLNRLRSESLSFDRFYVCPVSAPTRAQMLTGRYFLRTGVSSVTRGYENMRSDEVTIAEVLKDNGYTTGCFGKWHNGRYYPQHPNRKGFDEFVGFPVGHLGYYYDAWFLHNDEEKQSSGYTSDYFTRQAIEFMERNKENPFLCYVSHNVPHSPFQVPEKYFSKYRQAGLDSTLSCVYGMVENMDENIGLILQKLEDLDIADNTIVIFLSDNGPNTDRYNGGMKGRKGSVDEGGVRVPFYIKWPQNIKPGTTEQLAQDIDIMPTLLGLCRLEYDPEKPFDGIDLSGIINGKKKTFDRLIFSRQGNQVIENCNSSVRNDRYRLVLTRKDTLLYDMLKDPSQSTDIFDIENNTGLMLLSGLVGLNNELVSTYESVTTIEAGFRDEKSFTLPVQDALLSGKIRFSSIHPNQSHTENWIQEGDSIYWKLNINSSGTYKVEMQYGCPAGKTGSIIQIESNSGSVIFSIDEPFESVILPDRDYVRRSESVERTWRWMEIGQIILNGGPETVILKLLDVKKSEAGLIKALKFSRL
ncbi:MAG: arylsulfatase [Bacteroidales bacterium]|nr:arylsulfatase [Bacteroidales bacterium]